MVVWYFDVGLLYFGVGEGFKGLVVCWLKWYVSWVYFDVGLLYFGVGH